MEKMIFSRKSQLSFWGDGMAGVSVGKWANYEGGEGETPLHFLVDSFGADIRADAAFSGLLHRWEKVRKFAGHSARKVRNTQNDTREHIRTYKDTTERAMTDKADKARNADSTFKADGKGGARARRIDDGVVIGGLMSLTALAIVWTTHCVWIGALAAVAAIGVPVAMYYCTSRWLTSLSEQPHPAVALMQGFTMVFCGCILLGLTVYLYLGYAEPQWTDLTMRQLAVTQGDNGLGRAMASLVAHGHIPSAIQSSMFVMLLAMFGGCSATLLLTPLALRNNAKHRRPHKR